jgi:hypothetical protein
VFKAKKAGSLFGKPYTIGQPVLYIDSAKTSTLEGAATTVYAQGGKGNARLIAWEGEKTLTFTVEDALLSPQSLALLSGAGLFKRGGQNDPIPVHNFKTVDVLINVIVPNDMDDAIFVLFSNSYELNSNFNNIKIWNSSSTSIILKLSENIFIPYKPNGNIVNDRNQLYLSEHIIRPEDKTFLYNSLFQFFKKDIEERKEKEEYGTKNYSIQALIDYYTVEEGSVAELIIDTKNFAGNWYVEATTSFRRQIDGKDLKTVLTFPNVKIQSNFTFSMAATGDPSTFTFTMDAMPGYTLNNTNKKVLCEMHILDEEFKKTSNVDFNKSDSTVSNDESDFSDFAYEVIQKYRIIMDDPKGQVQYPQTTDRTWVYSGKKALPGYFADPVDTITIAKEEYIDTAYWVQDDYLYEGESFSLWAVDENSDGTLEDTDFQSKYGQVHGKTYILTTERTIKK